MRKAEFLIIEDYDIDIFCDTVARFLNRGYVLHGHTNSTLDGTGGTSIFYSQAMVRPKGIGPGD